MAQDGAGAAIDNPLAAKLLAAAASGREPAELAELAASAPQPEALSALEALGRSRQAAAAALLLAVVESSVSKDLRKEARRGLHRLRTAGLAPPPPVPAPARPPAAEQRRPVALEAFVTFSDGVGSRAMWLLAERPLGGTQVSMMILNDVVGMKACDVDETSRRRAERGRVNWQQRSGMNWIQIPPRYAQQLLGEALELNRESGFVIPRDYLINRHAFGDLALPFEQAIIYDEIPASEAALRPDLVDDAPELLDEEELKGWFFGFDEVERFARDMRQARQSQIVLSEQLRDRRVHDIISNAIRELVTPQIRRGLRRRLEEAAYCFLKTDRPRQARLALAAARRLVEAPPAPSPLLVHVQQAGLHPFLEAMMVRSLEMAVEVIEADVPINLVRRNPYDPVE